MNSYFYKAVVIFTIFFSCIIHAQPTIGKFINASIGYSISATTSEEEQNISGSGFYAQGEYVIGISKWFGVRPYAGIIITSPDKNENDQNLANYKVTSKAFLLGGKARICAPIPYVAPYIEIGLGASIGSFETYTSTSNIQKKGLISHIPFSIGLAIGKKHNIDVAFTYYFHQGIEQYSGAVAFGLSFPLDD